MSSKMMKRALVALGITMLCSLPLATEAQAATPNYGYAALQVAKNQIGDRYVYGATGPSAFDCSGLTMYSYEHSSQKHYLPRVAEAQYKYAKKVAWKNRRPGDLVFFHDRSGYVFHVGVYAGIRKERGVWHSYMIHAPKPGARVRAEDIYTNWGYSYVTFGRI